MKNHYQSASIVRENNTMELIAKYHTMCCHCGEYINPGDLIEWYGARRVVIKAMHVGCARARKRPLRPRRKVPPHRRKQYLLRTARAAAPAQTPTREATP